MVNVLSQDIKTTANAETQRRRGTPLSMNLAQICTMPSDVFLRVSAPLRRVCVSGRMV